MAYNLRAVKGRFFLSTGVCALLLCQASSGIPSETRTVVDRASETQVSERQQQSNLAAKSPRLATIRPDPDEAIAPPDRTKPVAIGRKSPADSGIIQNKIVVHPASAAPDGRSDPADPPKWSPRVQVGGYVGNKDLSRGEIGLFFPFKQDPESLFFADIRGKFFDGDNQEGNFAVGYRRMLPSGWNLGVWGGFDLRHTKFNNTFPQIAGGLEYLNTEFGFRLNGYIPLDTSKSAGSFVTTTGGGAGGTPTVQLLGTQLFLLSGGGTTTTTRVRELGLYGIDGEFEFRVPLERWDFDSGKWLEEGEYPEPEIGRELRVALGGFYFDHEDLPGEIAGPRVRSEWRMRDPFGSIPGSRLTFEVQYQYDDIRKSQIEAGLRFSIPFNRPAGKPALTRREFRMSEPIVRDRDVVTSTVENKTMQGGGPTVQEAVNDADTGVRLDRTVIVNGGDDLQGAINAAGPNSHIVALNGTAFDGNFTVQADQTFQGGGSSFEVIGVGSGLRATYTAPGSTPTLRDQTGATNSAVLTVNNNGHVIGVNILGAGQGSGQLGNHGISGTGVANVFIDQTTIGSTGGAGIHLDGANGPTVRTVSVMNTGTSGINITNGTGTFNFADTDDSDDSDVTTVNGTGAGFAGINIANSPTATFTFSNTDISNTGAEGILLNNAGTVGLSARAGAPGTGIGTTLINSTNGDAINATNTNLNLTLGRIGETGQIQGDGIEINNTDGVNRTANIIFNNIFGLGVPDPTGRGIFLNAQAGTLTADLSFNFIATAQTTILTRDGGTASNLLLGLSGNSTLSTANAVPVMDITGSGLNSTIVTSWAAPNQVIGGITGSSGILFDRVTFDADGNVGNGFQQVNFAGTLDIGQVPPSTIQRVEGNGLTFLNTTGDLRIGTLNVANQNGTGLLVDNKALGTIFNLDVDGGTLDTIGGTTAFLDPLTGNMTFNTINAPVGLIFDAFNGTFNVTDNSIQLTTGGTLALNNAPNVTIMNMTFAGGNGTNGAAGANGTDGQSAITVNNSTLTLDNATVIGGNGGDGGDATGAATGGNGGNGGVGVRLDANSTLNVNNGTTITGGIAGAGGDTGTGEAGSAGQSGDGIRADNGGNTINVNNSSATGGRSNIGGTDGGGQGTLLQQFGFGGSGILLDDDATVSVTNGSTIKGGDALAGPTGIGLATGQGGIGFLVSNGFDTGGVEPANVFNITIDNSTVRGGQGDAGSATTRGGFGNGGMDIFESNTTLNILNGSLIAGADGVGDPTTVGPNLPFNGLPGANGLFILSGGTVNITDSTVRGGRGVDADGARGAGDGGGALFIGDVAGTPGNQTVNITNSTIEGGDAGAGGQELEPTGLGGTLQPAQGGGQAINVSGGIVTQTININGSQILGGDGSTQTGVNGPTSGSAAVFARDGDTAVINVNTGSTLTGGNGGNGTGANDGADGDVGVRIGGGTVTFNAGSATTGGNGGNATGTGNGGSGGLGVDPSAPGGPTGLGTVVNNGGTVTNGTDGTP